MTFANYIPHINATLNSITAILLIAGYYNIRRGNRTIHRNIMLTATAVTAVFLVLYLTNWLVGQLKYFPGHGWAKTVYLIFLIIHETLAALNVPLVAFTLYYALTGNFRSHRKVAPWTLANWLFVSLSGVLIYWILFHVYA